MAMGKIRIDPVRNRSDLMKFIRLVWKINEGDPNWVPPLIIDRLKLLDRKKNPFYKHADVEFFLAYKNGEVVGRIAAIVNYNHNEFHKDKTGFFGFLEGINDPEVFEALLNTAKEWLKERDRDYMMGPMNPSTNDEIGFLIEGFDTPPFIMMTHNPPYYQKIMEELGYEKAKDVLAYYIHKDTIVISDKLKRVAQLTREKTGVKIRSANLKNFNEELERVRYVYNNAWARNWGFVPLTPEEIDFIADDFRRIMDPELVLLAEIDGEPVGFSLALPNLNEVFARIRNGRLFPTGWLKFLLYRKKVHSLRVITLGVVQKYQKSGIGGLFYLETFERGVKRGYDSAEMSWILEDNDLMNRAARLLGGDPYKRYRIYGTRL